MIREGQLETIVRLAALALVAPGRTAKELMDWAVWDLPGGAEWLARNTMLTYAHATAMLEGLRDAIELWKLEQESDLV